MNTLLHFNDFVNEITGNNSRKYKQEVLQKYKDDSVVQKYLSIVFDPYTVYGISAKKLAKEVRVGECQCPLTVFDLFDYLKEHNTGRDYDIAVCQVAIDWIAFDNLECAELLKKIICKDLPLGVDAKSINAVMPGLIPTFNVQLAQKYFDDPDKLYGKRFTLTTKIDGGRIIAIKENEQVSFFTRAGQRYEGLVDLEREMLETFPDGIVLDGEITIFDNAGVPSKEAYKQAMKITRSDGEKQGLKMLVFDVLPIEDWKAQKSEYDYEIRRSFLNRLFMENTTRKYFELLPELYTGCDTSKILEYLDKAIASKEEGIMVNVCKAKYEFGRTWSLMKVKKMNTLDLQIVDFEEGSGRLAGTLGAILVRYRQGNVVKVGSGFSDILRTQIWANQDKYLYSICEVQYFEETTNADGGISLRFPVFKDFRPDKLTPDF